MITMLQASGQRAVASQESGLVGVDLGSLLHIQPLEHVGTSLVLVCTSVADCVTC